MSFSSAIGILVLSSLLGNRILTVLVGLLLQVPPPWLLGVVVAVDWVQIPLFFMLYSHGASWFRRIPRLRAWLEAKQSAPSRISTWSRPLQGVGIFFLAFLPTLGGGMWSSALLAHNAHVPKRWSAGCMALGSGVSYGLLFLVLKPVVETLTSLMQ